MNKRVRIVKLDDLDTAQTNTKITKKTKTKDKYENILKSTERIKELLKNKMKTKKKEEEEFKNKFNYKKSKYNQNNKKFNEINEINQTNKKFNEINEINKNNKNNEINKNKNKNKYTNKRTQKKSKIKTVNINKQTINYIFKKITENKYSKENLLEVFRSIIKTDDLALTNKFITKINRKQTILLLSYLGIISINSKAPLPLLKNLLYNYLTSNIKIIK